MTMIFCRSCGKQIHETAPVCPHCGSLQSTAAIHQPSKLSKNGLWMAITSMILGIIATLVSNSVQYFPLISVQLFPLFQLSEADFCAA